MEPRPPERPTFAEVHGPAPERLRAADLRFERFLGDDLRASDARREAGAPRVVAVTGADGFLGRFVLLEALAGVPPEGRVVALVEAPNDEAAREQLAAAYGHVDPTLTGWLAALAPGRVEVVASDVTRPLLGLATERWARLAGEVDAVIHTADVKRAGTYEELFEPNVLGAVEAARLALARRAAIGFASTIGVAAGLDRQTPVREDEAAATLWPERPLVGAGYEASKWAAEVVLEGFAARAGARVSVFRTSAILPPRSFIGQVDAKGPLALLLRAIVKTRLAPRSLYPGAAKRPHFDAVAVDGVAHAMAAIVGSARESATYHVVDGHWDDGVSLDAIVDWTQMAGYPLERVEDHAAWERAFAARAREMGLELPRVDAMAPVLAFDCRRFREGLAALAPGEPAELPAIDELTLRQVLKNMVYAELIGHPGLFMAA